MGRSRGVYGVAVGCFIYFWWVRDDYRVCMGCSWDVFAMISNVFGCLWDVHGMLACARIFGMIL